MVKPCPEAAHAWRADWNYSAEEGCLEGDRPRPGRTLDTLVVVVAGEPGCHLPPQELGDGDRRRLHGDAGELAVSVVGDRVVGRGRDEDQVAFADLLGVAGHRHRAAAA